MTQHLQAIQAGIDPSGVYRYPGDIFDAPNGVDLSSWTVVAPGTVPDDGQGQGQDPQTGILNPPVNGG